MDDVAARRLGEIPPPTARSSDGPTEREQHAQKAAVKAHAALPQRQYLERMREVVAELVEQHVAKAPAEDDAEDSVEQHVVDVARMPAGEQVLARAILAEHHEHDKAEQVHQAVPAHRERAQLKRDRIELRMDEHGRL